MPSIIAVPGIETKSKEFLSKLALICKRIDINPDWLATCISFETAKTFSPSIRNKFSKAVGLIQFMPTTARRLGTTAEALAAMSDVEQLDWVYQYMSPFKGRLRSLEATYLAIFTPSLIGKPLDATAYTKDQIAYAQNKGFDLNKDGVITPREITAIIRGIYNKAASKPRIEYEEV